ncbi:MAG: hypothetical protein A2340_00855 [Lentisphaerae bacterium RIFOXYB12_FULL_60_10]|nr:MAG: hypothetical protein A2340_00855 [Lentisphaerae bacterium RIFOXYB12_FULL_60_10]
MGEADGEEGPDVAINPRQYVAIARQPATGSFRTGQAMVEFLVAMVALMVVVAALLQSSSLGRAHTDAMLRARMEVGRRAQQAVVSMEESRFIRDWTPGNDNRRYTRDDQPDSGMAIGFQEFVVNPTVPDLADWAILESLPDQTLPALRGASNPSRHFDLIKATESETITLLPAVQHLLYRSSTVTLEAEAWMPLLENLY